MNGAGGAEVRYARSMPAEVFPLSFPGRIDGKDLGFSHFILAGDY